MSAPKLSTLIPVYTTRGDAEAFIVYPYLYNRTGDWIGFITPKKEVYSVMGYYVGTLTNDPRIVRKRATSTLRPRLKPPPKPQKVYPPATVPLGPMMGDLSLSLVDVLMDEPERLHPVDSGEQRQDMD
ncbi:MAG: hypothetical protein IT310_02475 [Anaerolineales bacterium]|nr:hypothetical protein [Anaerolineales bacterium]